jgi:hypothetical protein
MSGVVLKLRPGAEPISWAEFCDTHPPYSIALDGYVKGASRFDERGPRLNLDHHADVDRLATRATCAQVWLSIKQGLFDAFADRTGRRATVFVNDCDEDVCLSWFLLKHPNVSSHPRLPRLVQAVDELDTTAGASLQPLDGALLRELAWIFEPYRQARAQGELDQADAESQRLVIEAVGQRISDYLAGAGQLAALDMRYCVLGGGPRWTMVREIGPHARAKMIADGIRAFVSVRPMASGSWSYTIGRVSPFIAFDVPAILQALNDAEESWRGTWGGGDLIGGSPRLHGSAWPPQMVARIVNSIVMQRSLLPHRSEEAFAEQSPTSKEDPK